MEAFRAARASYKNADDRIRVAIHEAGAIASSKTPLEAAQFLRDQAKLNTESDNVVILSMVAEMYDPKTSTKPAKAAKPKGR